MARKSLKHQRGSGRHHGGSSGMAAAAAA